MLIEVEVMHEWSKERVTLPVETVEPFIISVRWGMAGIYELDIRTNRMRARNPATRRKHPHCLWSAVDIESVRRAHWHHLNPGKAARDDEAYQRHCEGFLGSGKGTLCAISQVAKPPKNTRKFSAR